MISSELIDKYLRPNSIKEKNATTGWSDSNHLWIPDKEHGFLYSSIKEPNDAGAITVELEDHSVEGIASYFI